MSSSSIPYPGEDGKRRFESWTGRILHGREVARYGYSSISSAIRLGSEMAKREKVMVRITDCSRKRDSLSAVCLPDGRIYLAKRHGGGDGTLPLSLWTEEQA